MKARLASSKSGLFLIELIIAIVFFAVASAICTQLFVRAHLLSTRSRDMSAASAIAQNYVESLKGLEPAAMAADLAPLAEGGERWDYYDSDSAPLPGIDNAAYVLHLELSQDNALYAGTISVYSRQGDKTAEEPLCTLPWALYMGN